MKCTINLIGNSPTASTTVTIPVSTPSCNVPTPVNDALAYTGAIIALWVVVWAGRALYNFFKLPHADA